MKLSSKERIFDSLFMHGGEHGIEAYRKAVEAVVHILSDEWKRDADPYSGNMPRELHDLIKKTCSFRESGEPLERVLEQLKEVCLPHRIRVEHPKCIAHLHCPPVIPAVAAEMLISVMNLSMDSFDQSGAASRGNGAVALPEISLRHGSGRNVYERRDAVESHGAAVGARCVLRKAVELECAKRRTAS